MKKNIVSKITILFFVFILVFTLIPQNYSYSADGSNIPPVITNPQATGFNLDFTVPNPIQANNFDEFMAKLLEIVFLIAIPVITFFIIYSGFLFVTAQGNAEKIETAKKNFMWVLIGSAILLASWLLANAIGETVKQTFAP